MPSRAHKSGRPADHALPARRRAEILDVAAGLFAEHGYAATDTQSLINALGVGKGTIYRYFSSKRELFLAAVNRAMDRLDETIEEALGRAVDPLDRFQMALVAYLRFFEENPAVVELLIQERALFKDAQRPTYFQRKEAKAGRRNQMLQELIDADRLRRVPVERIGDVLGNVIYGTMFTNHFAGRRKSFELQVEDILDVIFHGILTTSERRKRKARDDAGAV
jgi:AcrR family transcriptional regulator